MFKGKLYILKDVAYPLILAFHSFLFAYFLYITFFNYIITIISIITVSCLIGLAYYSFLKSKPYYYYLYIGIVVSSIPIIFNRFLYLNVLFIAPEVLILLVLLINGLNPGSYYYKTRVNKTDTTFHHDAAVSGIYRMTPGYGVKMDEIWNPDSAISMREEGKQFEKVNLNRNLQLLSVLLTSVFFICAIISVVYFYSII
jgi:hypothetical protein